VTTPFHDEHLSASGLQAFLDDGLPRREHRAVEEHLAGCARCEARLEAWSGLFEGLDGLPRLVPHEGFQSRILADVRVPEARPWAARVWETLAGWLPGGAHLGTRTLQELAHGELARREAVQARSHLDGCRRCATAFAPWRALAEELGSLERLAPSPEFAGEVMVTWRLQRELAALGRFAPSRGFSEAVMAGVRLRRPAEAASPVVRPSEAGAWGRLQAAARRLVPQTRQAWAALSGVAVTPVVTLGLVAWTVFSHPALTAGSLASFAWWKLTDLASVAWSTGSTFALESAGVFQIWETLGGLLASPGTLALVGLAFCAGSLASSWVLYRHLIATPHGDGRYAHVHG